VTLSSEDSALARKAPVVAKFKLLYGSGGVIDGITTASLTYFLLFYLTTVCGLSGTLAGTALLVGLLLDAVADPMIGLLSDNTRSKLGRRYPYLLYSTIPLAILFGLMFSIPAWLSGTALMVYAGLVAMTLRIGLSVFQLPYVAVGAEVTDDYVSRSSIVTWRISFNMIGTFLAIGLGLGVFMAGKDGLLHRDAYVPFAWTCAAVIALAGLTSAYATRTVLPRLHAVAPIGEGPSSEPFPRELGECSATARSWCCSARWSLSSSRRASRARWRIYLNRYFWNLSDRVGAADADRRHARPVHRRAAHRRCSRASSTRRR
jgi:GPH family glycoside/pentoside/hexuronide:cation symporter